MAPSDVEISDILLVSLGRRCRRSFEMLGRCSKPSILVYVECLSRRHFT